MFKARTLQKRNFKNLSLANDEDTTIEEPTHASGNCLIDPNERIIATSQIDPTIDRTTTHFKSISLSNKRKNRPAIKNLALQSDSSIYTIDTTTTAPSSNRLVNQNLQSILVHDEPHRLARKRSSNDSLTISDLATPTNQLRNSLFISSTSSLNTPINTDIPSIDSTTPPLVESSIVPPPPAQQPLPTTSSTTAPSSLTQQSESHSHSHSHAHAHAHSHSSTFMNIQDIVQLGKIGSGNSGTVTKALHVPDSKVIAKKTIPVEKNNDKIINQLIRELTIMKNLKPHPNLVEFYGAFYDQSTNNEIIILLEYMNCGSLDKILSTYHSFVNRNLIPQDIVVKWFNTLSISRISASVLTGLSYLYDNYKIIHRDIKPSNILIGSKGQVKICDFGVSKTLINSIADTFVGTSTYMSPERIQGNVYSTKGDVWSLGLTLIELVTGEFPLGGHNDTPDGILDLLQRIVNEPSPSLSAQVANKYPPMMNDFIKRCCIKDEKLRPSMKDLLNHPFILNFNDKDKEFKIWAKRIRSYMKDEKQYKREQFERKKFQEYRKKKFERGN
ncbi:hypothetical protein TBLA_0F02350 [Henningerozyma blattae CBS 6284]|uniref:mitogen-activated protein kinase kinase n=1 Tax=Henningerozyma blattae (strain ATCC 34711 / CBS 6284 / DSM 70876 / NBRC 10599 / NRRL Y-10934 / UCD 77-7) TaxID=1071380 RepID=I2H5X4_HENB6|nr:hypothetical protein TBLA_0F02350 [Tetrapisispora blattae CBS 6284]CCH61776.1 hypothetical protein TBLA_0F02350 [Tetrapisispora blattae CBS 6284]